MSMKLVALTCPSCGGQMEVLATGKELHCPYCATLFLAPQMAEAEALREVARGVGRVAEGVGQVAVASQVVAGEAGRAASASERMAWITELDRQERESAALQHRMAALNHHKNRSAIGWGIGIGVVFAFVGGFQASAIGFIVGMVGCYILQAIRVSRVQGAWKQRQARAKELGRLLGERP